MEGKTVREWFEEYLPEDIRKKAIANTKAYHFNNNYLRMNTITFHDALVCAFEFIRTTEGSEYWYDILKNPPYFFDPVDPFKI